MQDQSSFEQEEEELVVEEEEQEVIEVVEDDFNDDGEENVEEMLVSIQASLRNEFTSRQQAKSNELDGDIDFLDEEVEAEEIFIEEGEGETNILPGATTDDEFEEQIIEKWDFSSTPDDLEGACRQLTRIIYGDNDPNHNADTMIRRAPVLAELYRHLKQEYWYKKDVKQENVEEVVDLETTSNHQSTLYDLLEKRAQMQDRQEEPPQLFVASKGAFSNETPTTSTTLTSESHCSYKYDDGSSDDFETCLPDDDHDKEEVKNASCNPDGVTTNQEVDEEVEVEVIEESLHAEEHSVIEEIMSPSSRLGESVRSYYEEEIVDMGLSSRSFLEEEIVYIEEEEVEDEVEDDEEEVGTATEVRRGSL